MPYGDARHNQIFRELVAVLGEDFVEDDPVVIEAFSRGELGNPYANKGRGEYIALPGSTEEVQQVVRLANRYGFPFSVTSTGFAMYTCGPIRGYPYWCMIDPKRMNHFSVDVDNMFAVVEPYVSIAQVQAESMKYGLFTGAARAGSQCSALGTTLFLNNHWTGWRSGRGRNLLGMEWVLPTGDIVRTGSLATPGGGYCMGEGPGPDARGLFRGAFGSLGALGIVTRMAIKLHPWPGPRIWPTSGVQPEKQARLPPELFKTFVLNYATLERAVEAVRRFGEAELGGIVNYYNAASLVDLVTRSREEFWERWHSPYWQKEAKSGHVVYITLWAFTSPKQVEYEEKVLHQIISETGGELVPEEEASLIRDYLDSNSVRDTHSLRTLRQGPHAPVLSVVDSLHDVLRSVPLGNAIKDQFSPPLGEAGENGCQLFPADFGRVTGVSVGGFGEKSSAEYEEVIMKKVRPEVTKRHVQDHVLASTQTLEASISGPSFANIHLLLASIKKRLDPGNLANPTRLVDMKRVEAMQAAQGKSIP